MIINFTLCDATLIFIFKRGKSSSLCEKLSCMLQFVHCKKKLICIKFAVATISFLHFFAAAAAHNELTSCFSFFLSREEESSKAEQWNEVHNL